MHLSTVLLDDLKPHPLNYNEHDAEQLVALQASLEQFGQVKNIVVWQGYILAGHGLAEAARLAGRTEIEVCDVSHLLEDDALAFLVADNETARKGTPDLKKLAQIVEELQERGTDTPGVTEADLAKLLRGGKAGGKGNKGQARRSISFRLNEEQMETLERALATAKQVDPEIPNDNTPKANAAALTLLCELALGELQAAEDSDDH